MEIESILTVGAQFFFADRLHPGTGLNTLSKLLRIEGPLDTVALASGLDGLVNSHASFRTKYTSAPDGSVRAVVGGSGLNNSLEVLDAGSSVELLEPILEALRRSLSPALRPWRAMLLRHGPRSHTLMLCVHRCCFDQPSFRTMEEALSAFLGGRTIPSEEDISRQSLWIRSNHETGLARFLSELQELPKNLNFPLKGLRPKVMEVAAGTVELSWPPGVKTMLRDLAGQWQTSELIVISAASAYVLAKYCSQTQIILGMPFSLFDRPPVPGMIQGGTTMLPLGFDTGAGENFEALVRSLTASYGLTASYADIPFQRIFQHLGDRWDPSTNPLFQVAFEEEIPFNPDIPGCECTPVFPSTPAQQLDLFFQIGHQGIKVGYAEHLVSRQAAQSLVNSVGTFLAAALKAPRGPLSELPITGAADRDFLVNEVNKTEVPGFLQTDLYELVSRHLTPDNGKTALQCSGRTMTYHDLGALVESVAGILDIPGDEAGPLVGICLPRSPEMVAAILAILRTGRAYVPLDPSFPADRLEYMAIHSGLTRVITAGTLGSKVPGDGIRTIDIEQISKNSPPARPVARIPGTEPAYVIYTSGSTGKPKGVTVPRIALANFISSMVAKPGIGPQDKFCAVTTLSFDIAGLELLGPLSVGGTVVIATEDEAKDPILLAALLRDSGTTVLQATPVTWQFLCASGWSGNRSLKALCGGEALTPGLAKELVPRVGELWNMYGPTETTVWSTCEKITDPTAPITVGRPIANTSVYVLDDHLRPVPPGVEGQLHIGGDGVALGYLHDPELTATKFSPDPFKKTGRMYDTGDRAKFDHQGALSIVGRSDFQVKIRGYRIELGEIETSLSTFPGISQAIVGVHRDNPANPELVAFFTLKPGIEIPTVPALRKHCSQTMPAYMVPAYFHHANTFPLTPNGKVDRKALLKESEMLNKPTGKTPTASRPKTEIEKDLLEIWRTVLNLPSFDTTENFFELGGTSVTALSLALEIGKKFHLEFSVLKIFEFPTISTLAEYLGGIGQESDFLREAKNRAALRRKSAGSPTAFDVAIVGAAGRFPGAPDLDGLWKVLSQGKNTVTVFDRKDLDPLVPNRDRNDPAYIPARGILPDIDLFDGNFFGIPPNEAELMDPQQRIFLEVCWEAFENAGYVGENIDGSVGVWAAKGNDFYYVYNVLTRPDKLAIMGDIAAEIANEKDHVAPRISHKLNLTGPSLSVHTACSSTLVVVENAYQALVTYQVDVALAGGVDIRTPQKSGQRYEDGGIFSDDGQCRPYDATATGTMFGEGAGAIILKRLDDALKDNDTILAVIKGAAVNHDGGQKVSYLAPSVEGQARVIASALALGDINPDTVTFIEGHGTATPMGDPIEVEALTRVFRAYTQRKGFCALGSIKGNFGHATTAAGIAGLLKIVLAMNHRQIPPTLNYSAPNPRIDFENSPFYVNNKAIEWKPEDGPLRAGVSSFGFCGTNAHIVLEEAPVRPASQKASRPGQLFLLSAKHPNALTTMAQNYADVLGNLTPPAFADAAYTTQVGRKRFEHRRCVVARTAEEAESSLFQVSGGQTFSAKTSVENPSVAFLFPGQGSQYINMGSKLYAGEPLFRTTVDLCCDLLLPHLGCDLRGFLFPDPADAEKATQSLNNTFYTQPAIFTVSYSLAILLKSWGIVPDAFVGHSIGEFVAATLSEVMSLEDALKLVAARGRLMQGLPSGSMLSVRLPEETLVTKLPAGIDMAAVNSPKLCVVAGPSNLVGKFADDLEAQGIACRKLHTSHAFHSSMMDPVVAEFQKLVETIHLSAPRIPFVSTVTGEWITAEAATDPGYWARHLRSPVQFSKAVRILMEDNQRVLVECGPRRTGVTLALQHQPENPGRIVATMPDSSEPDDEYPSILLALGTLWAQGAEIDWQAFHDQESRRRIALPTYAFQRRRYWIEPGDTRSFGFDAVSHPLAGQTGSLEMDEATDSATSGHGQAVGGQDPVMKSLLAILEDALGEQLAGFNEDAKFIELGLDSLLITQLARIVRQKLGFEVTFRQLSEAYSTPRLLAEAIRNLRSATKDQPPSAPSPAPGSFPKETPAADMTGARLGKDENGQPAWFIPDPSRPGKFIKAVVPHE